jgi:hypothetical protein
MSRTDFQIGHLSGERIHVIDYSDHPVLTVVSGGVVVEVLHDDQYRLRFETGLPERLNRAGLERVADVITVALGEE